MNKLVILLLLSWMIAFTTCDQSCSPYTEAMIPDCNCKTQSVEQAVLQVLSPLLRNITESTYFSHFFVDLEKPCPFWQEEGMCMLEACSVCPCEEHEIPKTWLEENQQKTIITNMKHDGIPLNSDSSNYGWINGDENRNKDNDDRLGRVTVSASITDSSGSSLPPCEGNDSVLCRDDTDNPYDKKLPSLSDREASKEMNRLQRASEGYLSHLHATEDCDTLHNDWTTVEEVSDGRSLAEVGVYVNLLQNPERYTGYSGLPAQRVWTAIAEENCFLPTVSSEDPLATKVSSTASSSDVLDGQCLETRVFHRLITGLRASITVHIAREYHYPNDTWAPYNDIFLHHIAPFKDRLHNMYFTFLFLLRAVTKAEDAVLRHTVYDTGDSAADTRLKTQLQSLYTYLTHSGDTRDTVLAECARAFNETRLFQPFQQMQNLYDTPQDTSSDPSLSLSLTATHVSQPQYFDYAGSRSAQALLREEFRQKFRNISRILDCVSCEKCRLWGKLQILGLGTAVKVLLHETQTDGQLLLRRQEVIALLNTLHQLTKSVAFAAETLPLYDPARHSNDSQFNIHSVSRGQVSRSAKTSRVSAEAHRDTAADGGDTDCVLDPRKSVVGVAVTALVCLVALATYYVIFWRQKNDDNKKLL